MPQLQIVSSSFTYLLHNAQCLHTKQLTERPTKIGDLTTLEHKALLSLIIRIYEDAVKDLGKSCHYYETTYFSQPTPDGQGGEKLDKPLELISLSCPDYYVHSDGLKAKLRTGAASTSVKVTDTRTGESMHLAISSAFVSERPGGGGGMYSASYTMLTIVPDMVHIKEQ